MKPMRDKAIRLSRLCVESPIEFKKSLHKEIASHRKRAIKAGLTPAIRLNVASDLDWTDVIEQHKDIQFYDYTKSIGRMGEYLAGKLPQNYDIIYSASELSRPSELRSILEQGGNIAQVFATRYVNRNNKDALPETVEYDGATFPVIDADLHDLRIPAIDGRGVVCGLRLKGTIAAKGRAKHNQFALPVLA
jgi:hypothetical protein